MSIVSPLPFIFPHHINILQFTDALHPCANWFPFYCQVWLFQGKICLVFDICCWNLLSWFWCHNCKWSSKFMDFTGTLCKLLLAPSTSVCLSPNLLIHVHYTATWKYIVCSFGDWWLIHYWRWHWYYIWIQTFSHYMINEFKEKIKLFIFIIWRGLDPTSVVVMTEIKNASCFYFYIIILSTYNDHIWETRLFIFMALW